LASGKPYPPGVLERLQKTELEILSIIDKICRENGFRYFIMGGNLLGAVRHGGFIPWDDDLDIGMPWDDYCRFREAAPSLLPDGYSMHDNLNTKGFSAMWTKIFKDGTLFMDEVAVESGHQQAIFLDILPFHQLAADEKIAWRQCRRGLFWQRMSYLHHMAHPHIPANTSLRPLKVFGCVAIHYTVAQLFSPESLKRHWLNQYEADYPLGTKWMNMSCTYNELLDEVTLFPTGEIDYDGLTVCAPHDIKAFLGSAFKGDYMTPPPMEDRYTHLPEVLDFGDGINVMEGW